MALSEELENIIIFIIETEFIRPGFVINTYILQIIAIRCAFSFPYLVIKTGFMASTKWYLNIRQCHDYVFRRYTVKNASLIDYENMKDIINNFEQLKKFLIEK